jgi:hypothetical protein
MNYRERLHGALDAILTKATMTGQDYEAIIPVSFLELAKDQGMKIHEDMTALGIEVLIQVTLTDKDGPVYEPESSDTSKTRH